MIPDPKLLAEAGGWAVVVALGIGLAVAFVRGWLVPGWIYRAELERSDRIEKALTTLTQTVESVADDISWNIADRYDVRRQRGRNG